MPAPSLYLSAVDPRPVVDALRALLAERGVPSHRVELAVRATDSLLRNAITRRDDGAVYVITGDIPAMWLRDSAAQVRPLLALAGSAPEVIDVVKGVLRLQIEQVLLDPRANAFNPGPTGAHVRGDSRELSPWVFERKYELDSLCAPLALAWLLWRTTGSVSHLDARFHEAARAIVNLWRDEQSHDRESFVFRRRVGCRRGSLSHRGRGAPVAWTGMSWSGFRPSDDACTYGYNIPANAYAAVALTQLDDLLLGADQDRTLAAEAHALATDIRSGIADFGVVEDVAAGRIYAYEVDGLGSRVMLDDANVPSLLSLPYLGFCAPDDPLYRATRSWVLSARNPTWTQGRTVRGVGSKHSRRRWVWPLAIAIEGLTAIDERDREEAICRVEATVTGDLLFHEAVDPDAPQHYTRRWFSWADMLYVEVVLASVGLAPSGELESASVASGATEKGADTSK